ncbi:MAG: hypothetical protein QGI45_14630 [Myxococcota bacterium]|jgi:hypothetical protein|nr:hypothetical protein [Myxococcota bacterium]
MYKTLHKLFFVTLFFFSAPLYAFDHIEGAVLGDQGYFWESGTSVWILPNTLSTTSEQAILQFGDAASLATQNLFHGPAIQTGDGGGFVLAPIEKLKLGFWMSNYAPGYTTFISNGISNTGWNTYTGFDADGDTATADDTIEELQAIDPYVQGGTTLDANRKLDLFVAYDLPHLNLNTGLHLWWGSTHNAIKPDDSTGPIDILPASDTSGLNNTAVVTKDISEGTYSLSELGMGFAAGYKMFDKLSADLGINFNMVGTTWEPNGIKSYLDAGGNGFDLSLRTHYALSNTWTFGGFIHMANQSMSFKPLSQRDGGDLIEFIVEEDNTLANPPNATPQGGAEDPNNEKTPVKGITYTESATDLQLAGLIKYQPNTKVSLYAATGFGSNSQTTETSVGSNWFNKTTTSTTAMPFLNLGIKAQLTSFMDLYMGSTKRWQGQKVENHAYDVRIPNDELTQGGGETVAGAEKNTNANRRNITTTTSQDTSSTQTMIGTKFHFNGFAFMAQVNPATVLSGTYLLSGTQTNPWIWASLSYAWDKPQARLSTPSIGQSRIEEESFAEEELNETKIEEEAMPEKSATKKPTIPHRPSKKSKKSTSAEDEVQQFYLDDFE